MESWVQSWWPRTNAFCDFSSPKVLRLPRKSDATSYEVLHLSRKIISANLQIWCSKMQPLSGNQRPHLLTSLMNMSCTTLATENASLQILFKCPTPAIVSRHGSKPSRFAHFWQGAQSLAPATQKTSERQKVVRTRCVFNILTSKCASFFDISTSKSGPDVCFVHFDFEMCFAPQTRALFDISTSKSGPELVWFVHFDFDMCFAPQRRALFRHLNFEKWSGAGVLCTFWLRNVLRTTTACTFSTSQLLKVVRT